MAEYDTILLNETHLPNNPLQAVIVKEVNRYIGYAYADDIHLSDYLTIDKTTLAVSHARRFHGEPSENNLAYYSMSRLITEGDTFFTYEPDHREIDAVVLDFFPIEVLNNFPELVESAIFEYSANNDITEETSIGFPIDTFKPIVFNPSELEFVEDGEEEECLDGVAFIEVPAKEYIRKRNGNLVVNKHKLLLLALNNYYGD